MKKGKAIGIDGTPAEVWKCSGEEGIDMSCDLMQRIYEQENLQMEWLWKLGLPGDNSDIIYYGDLWKDQWEKTTIGYVHFELFLGREDNGCNICRAATYGETSEETDRAAL